MNSYSPVENQYYSSLSPTLSERRCDKHVVKMPLESALEAVGSLRGLRQRLPDGPTARFAQAMPEQYRDNDAVVAYRAF